MGRFRRVTRLQPMSANRSRPVQKGNDDDEKTTDYQFDVDGPAHTILRVIKAGPDDATGDDVQAVAVRYCNSELSIEQAWREHGNTTLDDWGGSE